MEVITVLQYKKRNTPISTKDLEVIHHASQIFLLEGQQLLTTIFPTGSSFWKYFHQRYTQSQLRSNESSCTTSKNQISLMFVPIDALHYATQRKHQLEYELLLQIIKIIYNFFYGKQQTEENPFRQALNLSNRLNLAELDAWIISLSQKINQ
jgi:hypothetical protein